MVDDDFCVCWFKVYYYFYFLALGICSSSLFFFSAGWKCIALNAKGFTQQNTIKNIRTRCTLHMANIVQNMYSIQIVLQSRLSVNGNLPWSLIRVWIVDICISNWQSPKTLRFSIMQYSPFEWIYGYTRLCLPFSSLVAYNERLELQLRLRL